MYGVTIKIIIETFLGIAAGILMTVPVHELGHLLGGLLSGYRFASIGIMGVYIYRNDGGLRLKYRNDAPLGQCIMSPGGSERTPVLLITGGILANLAGGAVLTWLGVHAADIDRTAVLLSAGGIMASLGILNAVPFSRTNDAATLCEILRFEGAGKLYNRLMLVYSELEAGRAAAELSPGNLKLGVNIRRGRVRLDSGHFKGCSIAEELLHYRQLKEKELPENAGMNTLREGAAYDF